MSDFSRAFGRVVRSRRRHADISQEALAERAGIHRTHLSEIETGKVRIGLDIAKQLADGLGVALATLVAEAEETGRGSDPSV